MVKEVVMPKLGMAMKEGVVSAWYKHAGDPIAKGEVIASIHSEKIEMDLEAPDDGEILKIEVEENYEVPPGTVICYIGEHSEKLNDPPSLKPDQLNNEEASATSKQSNYGGGVVMNRNTSVKISPVARKMAAAAGMDVHTILGTGPGGRITKEDVERTLRYGTPVEVQQERKTEVDAPINKQWQKELPSPDIPLTLPKFEAEPPMHEPMQEASLEFDLNNKEKVVPVTGMRKVIASRMLNSIQNSAQLTLFSKVDVTELKELQNKLLPTEQNLFEEKLTITDFIARAVVLSLQKHKEMNCAMIENAIHMQNHVHLGIAVALDNGLVVPVIRNAEQSSIKLISKALKNLSLRARKGELRSDEMQGSTFSITNLGTSGVEYFTPILNPPETGILGIGSIKDEPIFVGEELKRRSLLPLSLTFDHRVIDGAPAAAFLHSVKEYLEQPLSLLL